MKTHHTQHYTVRIPGAYTHRVDECVDHFINQGLELVDIKVIPGNFIDSEQLLVIFKRDTQRDTPIKDDVDTNWRKVEPVNESRSRPNMFEFIGNLLGVRK